MKKFLALLLAIVMVLGMLAGCGSKKKTSSTKKSSSKKDKESTSATDDTDGTDGTGSTDDTGSTNSTGNTNNEQTNTGNGGTNNGGTNNGGTNNDQPNGGTVRPYPGGTSGVAAGTLLDQPEKLFDAAAVNSIYISVDAETDGQAMTVQVAVINQGNGKGLIYAVNGPADTEQAVYEVSGSNIVKYAKNLTDSKFKLDNTTSVDDIEWEVEEIGDFLQTFIACQEAYDDIQFRKSNAVTTAPTGAVYAYDVVYEGKVDGLILIDQKTGLLVKVEAFSSDFCYTVTNFKTTDVQIPSYK